MPNRRSRQVPPPLEMLCLKALWSLGEASVRDVQKVVCESRPLAYTTVMTVLDRLAQKDVVSRRKVGRAFLYAAKCSRDSVQVSALKEFVDGFFDGSEAQLFEFLRNRFVRPDAAPPPVRADGSLDAVLL